MTKTEKVKAEEIKAEQSKQETENQNENATPSEEIKEATLEEKEIVEESNDFLNLAKRVQADFDNYRRRTNEEMKLKKDDGKIEALSKLIPCLDLMQKARKMMESNADVVMGFDMVIRQFEVALKELGAEKIEVKGKPFDPAFANAIAMLCVSDKPDCEVLEEILPGYTLGGRIVRYANVVVNKLQ